MDFHGPCWTLERTVQNTIEVVYIIKVSRVLDTGIPTPIRGGGGGGGGARRGCDPYFRPGKKWDFLFFTLSIFHTYVMGESSGNTISCFLICHLRHVT